MKRRTGASVRCVQNPSLCDSTTMTTTKTARSRRTISANGRGGLDRENEILDVAAVLFAKRGYQNTDVQVIADTLCVGKGSIYRRYSTKRDLFLAAADRGMRLLIDEIN